MRTMPRDSKNQTAADAIQPSTDVGSAVGAADDTVLSGRST